MTKLSKSKLIRSLEIFKLCPPGVVYLLFRAYIMTHLVKSATALGVFAELC